ncbi:nuclear transport factor 2 family protein [Streptomyces bobili]|uniref:nuclear transport factor 2 family protein n=1 Tax=Streptomyces bobili TaxID=67280 RepID=UPI00364BEE10
MTAASVSDQPDTGPGTVDEAEAAWLAALTHRDSVQLIGKLLRPEAVVVHGPVGHLHDRDTFLSETAKRSPANGVTMHDVTVRRFGDTAIVSGVQEMRAPFVPDATDFVIQAVVTRVWVLGEEGWKLAHLQMARRFPPG